MKQEVKNTMKSRVYLDYAATTPLSEAALEAMLPFFRESWGNPSAVYAIGREARKALENARRQTAAAIGADVQEVCFVSGGSESDSMALRGTAYALRERGTHIITSAVEHHAVLNTSQMLRKEGFEVTIIQPDGEGFIDPEAIRKEIREDTVLISVMAANNEIGTLEPVAEIGKIARGNGILFHIDAVQAVGAIPVDVNRWNADLLSLSAHKFRGPKGTGALYIRKGTRIDPLINGGEQERGLRAGTENVPGIVGMGQAIEEATEKLGQNAARNAMLRNRLAEGILSSVPDAFLNGAREERLPNNCSIRFEGIDGEALLLRLDLAGIAASAGSACTAGSQEISHVLKAIGLSDEEAKSSLRLTTGEDNTENEIDETIQNVKAIVKDLRRMFRG